MNILKPEYQVLTIWRILLIAASFPLALAIALFLTGTIYKVAAFFWFLIFLFGYLFYLPRLFESLLYIMDDKHITLKKGVFYNSIYTIPLENIQFTNLIITPFSRLFGIVSLRIVAPGASISLPGLCLDEARAISKVLGGTKEPANGG